MSSVAVWGATGFVGRYVVKELLQRGHSVRALMRGPLDESDGLRGHVEEYVLDFDSSPELLIRILDGVSCAIHCAGDPKADQRGLESFVSSVRNYASAAHQARVRKLILFSSLTVYGPKNDGVVRIDELLRPDSEYGRSRKRAEEEAATMLASSATECCVVRIPAVVGTDMRSNVLRHLFLSLRCGFFFHPGHRDAVFPCVGSHRLAACIARLVEVDFGKIPKLIQLSDSLRWADLMAWYGNITGRTVRRLTLPPKLCQLMAAVFGRTAVLRVKVFDNHTYYETGGVPTEILSTLPGTEEDVRALIESIRCTKCHGAVA